MNILITGSNGFIGKNLIANLKATTNHTILPYDREISVEKLEQYCEIADYVFHLAGVNRPEKETEFMEGNYGFSSVLLSLLKKYHNTCPVMISSSIQADLDNPYGASKKAGEDLMRNYSKEVGAPVLIYRFPNVFGKWSQPNYNSAVATFCFNIARDIPIQVNNRETVVPLVYIDDVVQDLITNIATPKIDSKKNYYVTTEYKKTLGEIVDLLYSFKESRENREVADMSDSFVKKLYSTYTSFLPEEGFSYDLKMNTDDRGSFTEFIRTPDRGQVSVNVSKPGIVKGNHWHNTKNEKFLVVKGDGMIRFRKIDTEEVIEYHVTGKKLEVVDIPVGYTHNIENVGKEDLVTVMWVNESFNPDEPDTYFLEV